MDIPSKILHEYLQSSLGNDFPLANPYKNKQLIDTANLISTEIGYVASEMFHTFLQAYRVIG
ncbi:hypothetical protein [Vibrio owensii]|uniref:hypothetical protein n=1 Tax=Vibrio owensii TaxID=696485 RepID=UPI004068F61F